MREIESAEKKRLREHRQKVIVMSVMLGLLLLSSAGFAFSFAMDYKSQNNNPSSSNSGENNPSAYRYSPEEVANISVNISLANSGYQGKVLYIDSDNEDAFLEVSNALSAYASKVQDACYGKCERDAPEKGCGDNLIVINSSKSARVYQNQSCVFIDGGMQSVDAFLYKLSA